MSDPADPKRWLDAASPIPEGLRDVLRRAEADVGTPEQLVRLSARLGPAFASGGATTSSTTAATALKVAGVVGLVLAGGAGVTWLTASHQPEAARTPERARHVQFAANPSESPREASRPSAPLPGPSSSQSSAPNAAEPSPPTRVPNPPATNRRPAVPPASEAAALSEAQLLESARRALASSPALALSRASEHKARFPGGMLTQEREIIAIEALRRLGRAAEAKQRAHTFSKTYPNSTFRPKLDTEP